MIRRIQVLNYRCLRYVDLPLDRFHLLVGPNASGKSTLLDVIALLGDLVREGLESAVGKRAADFRDLVWNRPRGDGGFELSIEVDVPEQLRGQLPPEKDFTVIRYEIAIRDDEGGGPRISSERALLMPPPKEPAAASQRSLFPNPPAAPATIMLGRGRAGMKSVVSKSDRGTDSYYVETASGAAKGWVTTIAFGPHRSTLANLPESPAQFPVATFLKRKLEAGARRICLDAEALRRPSPPDRGAGGLAEDGSNLPWMVKRLHDQDPSKYGQWLERVRTVLTDLAEIRAIVRPEDRCAYLVLGYGTGGTGVEVPSWTASEGTLRLLALTLLDRLPGDDEIYLLENPEDGIHPSALGGVLDSLRSARRAQVLATTHSPAVLGFVEPSDVLCFDKDPDGATDMVRGSEHPAPHGWQASLDGQALFAKGTA